MKTENQTQGNKRIAEKPKKPIEPQVKDYPREGRATNENSPFIVAYRKYQKDTEKYNVDIELYEQTKLMRFIKNADIRLCLKKYKIVNR